jgi:hypothetical protein
MSTYVQKVLKEAKKNETMIGMSKRQKTKQKKALWQLMNKEVGNFLSHD